MTLAERPIEQEIERRLPSRRKNGWSKGVPQITERRDPPKPTQEESSENLAVPVAEGVSRDGNLLQIDTAEGTIGNFPKTPAITASEPMNMVRRSMMMFGSYEVAKQIKSLIEKNSAPIQLSTGQEIQLI